MTKTACTFTCLLPLLLLVFSLQAQTPDVKNQLKNLTADQKEKMLEYMRQLGGNVDEEIQIMFSHLKPAEQTQVQQYLNSLQKETGTLKRTLVRWDRSTISLGKIEEGTIFIDSFTVTNIGQHPYVISDSRTSCDCTVLRTPKYPLMPGESAVIRIEFDSKGKIGKTKPGIILYDNSSPNARNILYIEADIVPRKPVKNPWDQ